MQRLEVSGAVRPLYGSLGVKWLIIFAFPLQKWLRERALMLPYTASSVLLKLHIGLFTDALSVTL